MEDLDKWPAARLAVSLIREEFPENWDGEGASQVSVEAQEAALKFLTAVESAGKPPPGSIYPLAGGTVMCEWYFPSERRISVEIREQGTISMLVSHKGEMVAWHRCDLNDTDNLDLAVLAITEGEQE